MLIKMNTGLFLSRVVTEPETAGDVGVGDVPLNAGPGAGDVGDVPLNAGPGAGGAGDEGVERLQRNEMNPNVSLDSGTVASPVLNPLKEPPPSPSVSSSSSEGGGGVRTTQGLRGSGLPVSKSSSSSELLLESPST